MTFMPHFSVIWNLLNGPGHKMLSAQIFLKNIVFCFVQKKLGEK